MWVVSNPTLEFSTTRRRLGIDSRGSWSRKKFRFHSAELKNPNFEELPRSMDLRGR